MNATVRPIRRGDLPALVHLWNRTMWADPISQQRLMQGFLLDPHVDADACLLAEIEGTPVGFVLGMTARPDVPSDNAVGTGVIVGFGVDPAHRRQGIGTRLLQSLETYWATRGVSRIQIGPWVPTYLTPGLDETAYPGTAAFLQALGYTTGSQPVSMRALLTGYVPAADVPAIADRLEHERITIRPAVVDDAIDLIAFARDHFAHWEAYIRSALRALVAADATATLHIAVDGDQIIGFAMTTGERFGPFGVNDAYRGRGVGAVLLSRALCAMRAANIHAAYFLWTSDQTARLYTRHGFELARRFTMMSKEIRA